VLSVVLEGQLREVLTLFSGVPGIFLGFLSGYSHHCFYCLVFSHFSMIRAQSFVPEFPANKKTFLCSLVEKSIWLFY
jgi:hypothetical protein